MINRISVNIANRGLRIPALKGTRCKYRSTSSGRCLLVALLAVLSLVVSPRLGASTIDLTSGLVPYMVYDNDGIGAVNLATGNLVLNIPIITYKQLGSLPDYSVILVGNRQSWLPGTFGLGDSGTVQIWQTGLNSGVSIAESTMLNYAGERAPYLDDDCSDIGACYTWTYITDGTGSSHVLGNYSANGHSYATDTSGYSLYSSQGGATVETGTDTQAAIYDRKGNQYLSWCTTKNYHCTQIFYMVTDTRGNKITYNYPSGAGSLDEATSITDSVGRTIPRIPDYQYGISSYPSAHCSYTLNYPGVDGSTYPVQICYKQYSAKSSFNNAIDDGHSDFVSIAFVTLPNGTSWQFSYNTWGDISSITLPTGAVISYEWASCTLPSDLATTSNQMVRAISSRTVSVDGKSYKWTYQYAYNEVGSSVTVKDPDGNYSVHTFGLYAQYETEADYYDSSNNLIKKVSTEYNTAQAKFIQPTTPMGVVPKKTTTQWADGMVSAECTIYDNNSNTACSSEIDDTTPPSGPSVKVDKFYTVPLIQGSPMYRYEYDYGSGAAGHLLRKTVNSYKWQNSTSYFDANLLDLDSQRTIYDGSGTLVAQTTYGYDEANGSPQGVYGNLTSVTQWLNSGGSSPVTQTIWNSYGMPSRTLDANGNATTYAYDSTHFYVKSLTFPIVNSVPHIEQYTYDSNFGKLKTYTDQNGSKSQYAYNDSLFRVTQIDSAIGTPAERLVRYTYPSILETDERRDRSTKGDGALSYTHVRDQLNRPSLDTITSDPSGATNIDYVTYDSHGRPYQSYNPTRCDPTATSSSCSESTFGYVTYAYDAVGRVISVTRQDNTSKVAYDYSAYPCTTTTDEDGNATVRCVDGLGRLTKVTEPGGAITYYTYDALNNLTNVQSAGVSGDTPRTRIFSYDSLSRLHSAMNPETGAVGYIYDANGNVQTKTDARNVVTTYSYDALNRMVSKTYSDTSTNKTPWSCYQYDLSSITNGIGRLSNAWTQSSGTACQTTAPTSGFLTERSISAYDPMGRITQEQQFTLATQAAGTPYSSVYKYDLVGNLISTTSGVGPTPITLGYTFDAAGRLQTVMSNFTGTTISGTTYTYPTTLFSPPSTSQSSTCENSTSLTSQYSAFGGLMNATFGSGLTLNRTFDNRFRTICEIDMGGVGNATSGSATVTITGAEKTK